MKMSPYPVTLLLFMGLGLFSTLVSAQSSQPGVIPSKPPSEQPEVTLPEIGFEFEGSPTFNNAELTETTYTGDCPGVTVDRDSFKARFYSSQNPPGEGRRVVIKNITTGMGDPAPYTDRDYSKGRLSESTTTEFGTEHSSKKFRVVTGTNLLSYEVRERGLVLESGQFQSTFKRNTQQLVRNAQWYEAKVCANSAITTNVCADLRRQKQFRCPNGDILRREMLDSENSSVRTLISNQSNRVVRLRISNELYSLEPGERLRFRRSSTNSFSVYYNGDCADCKVAQSTFVAPGKRLQFVDRGKGASGNRVELVDYPTTGEIEEE